MPNELSWWISIEGRSDGPYSKDEVDQRLRLGTLSADSYVCPAGTKQWRRVAEIPELADLLEAIGDVPPPPPPDEYLSKPASWNPIALVWLGILFWPTWTGVMTALNSRRLELDQPVARPIGIGVGAELVGIIFGCSGIDLGVFLEWILYVMLPLGMIWYFDLSPQLPVYQQRKPTSYTHWMFPLLIGIPFGILTLLIWLVILFVPEEPVGSELNYPPVNDSWNYSSSIPRLPNAVATTSVLPGNTGVL
ncbi:DUF4339 domain-containing protein [bacterium]|nr:DUF4339 domain-containing protein [bacterium]